MSVSLHDFKVHSFDTDAFGLLTAPGLLGYLLESAGRSADNLGFGIAKLQEQALTWVIARIKIELKESLCFGEELQVQTWPSGLMRSAAMRDFTLLKGDRVVGHASSLWFVLDMESRLPVRPHEILPVELHPQTDHVVTLSRAVAAFTEPAEIERKFSVRFADIDLNQHVTAASYLSWAMEAVPQSVWATQRLQSIDVQYLEECHLGSEILTSSRELVTNERSHRICRSQDNREIARMLTTWAPRGQGAQASLVR
jgi:medium-chain acyl-[acyl-carrier-protein] hydrolase